jgi:hypothetical protein
LSAIDDTDDADVIAFSVSVSEDINDGGVVLSITSVVGSKDDNAGDGSSAGSNAFEVSAVDFELAKHRSHTRTPLNTSMIIMVLIRLIYVIV